MCLCHIKGFQPPSSGCKGAVTHPASLVVLKANCPVARMGWHPEKIQKSKKKKQTKRCFGVQLYVLGPIPAVIFSPFAGAKAQSPSGLPESPGFGPILHFPLGVSRSRAGRTGEGAEPSGQGRGERTANTAPLAVWFPSMIYSSLLKGEGSTRCSELPERLLAGHSEGRQRPQEGMHLRPVLPQK